MSKRGIRVWELVVLVILIGGGLVVFVHAGERMRWHAHALVPTAHMQDILAACDRYHEVHQQWPTVSADVKPYLTRLEVYEGLADGWYVVVWDHLPGDNPEAVLVYEKRVPEGFGYVCYRDGRVELLTGDQAKAVISAGKN